MDVEVGLLSLPCELHAMMLVQLSWRDFASLRLANRPLADGAGLCMLERLKAAAAAYASPAYSKVLQHDKLASWPVRSGALAVLLPASEWAALVSTASPLLEFWLRHELVAPQPVYLQYLCAARPPDRAVGPRGDTSGSFYRPVVGPEQLAAWATLRQLHLRALLRYDATSLPGGGIRGVCEEVLALLRGRQHLDALDAGEPSPLDPPAARLLADALFTAALALHHSSGATPGAPSSAALALYRQCRALLRRAMDVWTSVDQPPGGLGKHSTQLAVCQALAGEAAAEESGGAPARALPLLEEAEAGLAELLPRVETSLGAARPPG